MWKGQVKRKIGSPQPSNDRIQIQAVSKPQVPPANTALVLIVNRTDSARWKIQGCAVPLSFTGVIRRLSWVLGTKVWALQNGSWATMDRPQPRDLPTDAHENHAERIIAVIRCARLWRDRCVSSVLCSICNCEEVWGGWLGSSRSCGEFSFCRLLSGPASIPVCLPVTQLPAPVRLISCICICVGLTGLLGTLLMCLPAY